MCNSRRTENLSAPFDDSDGVFVPSCPPIAGTMKHACGLCILRSAVSINWDDVIRKGYCQKWICMLPGRLFSRECLTCSKWLAAALSLCLHLTSVPQYSSFIILPRPIQSSQFLGMWLICWATISAFCALLSSLLTHKDDDDDGKLILRNISTN